MLLSHSYCLVLSFSLSGIPVMSFMRKRKSTTGIDTGIPAGSIVSQDSCFLDDDSIVAGIPLQWDYPVFRTITDQCSYFYAGNISRNRGLGDYWDKVRHHTQWCTVSDSWRSVPWYKKGNFPSTTRSKWGPIITLREQSYPQSKWVYQVFLGEVGHAFSDMLCRSPIPLSGLLKLQKKCDVGSSM